MKIFWFFLSALAAAGLLMAVWSRKREERPAMFIYYTNLSNLLIFAYYRLLIQLGSNTPLAGAVPRLVCVTAISLTMFIFAFVLSPEYSRRRRNGEPVGQDRADSYILHYAVPIACIAEWFLFAPKASLRLWHSLFCLLPPMCYCIFIFVRAAIAGNIPGRNTPFPYGFMDVQKHGMLFFVRNAAVICLMLILVGMAYIFLGQLLNSAANVLN